MSELKIVFLGTGSARPTPRRNVAGLYLQYGGDAVLFDCGEGTQLQLLKAGVRMSRLVAICVTHFHGDHVNGLPGFLGTMGLNGYTEPLTVVGPRGMDRWFETLDALGILRPAFPIHLEAVNQGEVFAGEGFRIDACRVRHRISTHGFIFRENDLPGRFDPQRARELGVRPGPDFGILQSGGQVQVEGGRVVHGHEVMGTARRGRSIAYITDTRPSESVVEAVEGVDILVHEATYLHELKSQARERGHSTVQEAAEVAREAGVKQLVLTHISPKHTRRGELLSEARAIFPNTDLAEDFSEFSVPVPE